MPFLTPNTPPSNQSVVRRIVLPGDNTWTSVFDGMLLDLTYPWNWETYGDLTAQETADWFKARYTEFTQDATETPYSENASDLDGMPEYPWYEQVYDWIIAGFLAITFTPNAALVYQATIPKLRLAIRSGNLGALFRVLVNNVEVWSGDSYSASVDILTHEVDMSTFGAPPYSVRIVHNGSGPSIPPGTAAKLEYVRSESVYQMVQTILRADPMGCGVQWSLDSGDTWETVDLSACIATIADGRIDNWVDTGGLDTAVQDSMDDGSITLPGIAAPQGSLSPGQCVTLHVALNANNQWVCPVPVQAGYDIQISGAAGAWCDGGIDWRCPDGSWYFVGACDPLGKTHVTGDISASAYHMALVGKLLTAGTVFDPLTSTYTVPDGTAEQLFVVQANDGTLADNLGEVQFDVAICNGQWVHRFDAAHGLANFLNNNGVGTWDGTAWHSHPYGGSPHYLYIGRNLPALGAGRYLRFVVHVASTINGADTMVRVGPGYSGAVLYEAAYQTTLNIPAGYAGGGVFWAAYQNSASDFSIDWVEISGTGADPF